MTRPGRPARVAVTLLALLAPSRLLAQRSEPPCVLDKCLGLKPDSGQDPKSAPADPDQDDPPRPGFAPRRGGGAPGNFDFYVLALSWSPGFCATGGASKAREQCASGSNLGFVVHGLWPQFTRGYPSDCGPAGRVPSRQALDTVRGVYPDIGLARYEWMKHGTCSGKSPTDYFADVKAARDAIAIPQPLQRPSDDQTWAPLDVARAFVAANGGLRTDQLAVTCRQGMLAEVRICLSKDLRATVPCPEVARGTCRTRQITVPGLR